MTELEPPTYEEELWGAAMQLSYALEGVKDQRSINKMVAHSILDNDYKFRVSLGNLGWRERGRLQKEINLIAGYHEGATV
jgi:hypothetical protein